MVASTTFAPLFLAAGAMAYENLVLMPLGASITFGYLSSDGNGYRQDLETTLQNNGFTVDMVGSQTCGNMADNQCEGYPGLKIADVEGHAKADVPTYNPNIYTINLGTNDAIQNDDVGNAGARMGDLINYLYSATPDATVILSTLIINTAADVEARVEQINQQYVDLANSLISQGKKLVLADMHGPDGPQTGDMADQTHPNDVGYGKMAAIWWTAIQNAAGQGFLN